MTDRESRDLSKFLERSPRKSGKPAERKENRTPGIKLDLSRDLGLSKTESNNNDNELDEDHDDEDAGSRRILTQFDIEGHPVYGRISVTNGEINRMSLHEMKHRCRQLRLDNLGKREAVKRRLKEYYKRLYLVEAGLIKPTDNKNVDFLVVIDFEATCEERNPADYQHEIIEFPAVLVSTARSNKSDDAKSSSPCVVDVFHSFVRPEVNPQLSEFCRALTGIEQSTVDGARLFKEVHEDFVRWLRVKHRLGIEHTFTVVTDGPFDMGRFLFQQTSLVNIPFPTYADHWVNLRKAFANFYSGDFYCNNHNNNRSNNQSKLPGLQAMLSSLGMEFEGQPHSGLDDAKNIARVVVRMLEDGGCLRVNERINSKVPHGHQDSYTAKLRNVTPVNKYQAEDWSRNIRKEVAKNKKLMKKNSKEE